MTHAISYDLARALHIIAVIAWMAGLLMLPRLYAYAAESKPGGELETAMIKAARNLRVIILGPAMILAWAFGLFLLLAYVIGNFDRPALEILAALPIWVEIKLALVVILSGYHGFLISAGRKIAGGQRVRSADFWKLLSEVPFLIAIIVVLLAVLKPRFGF